MKLFEETRTLSRTDLATWLHGLATQIEADGELSFSEAEQARHVAVAQQTLREVEIEQSGDGARTKLGIEIEWSGTGPSTSAATSGDADGATRQSYHGNLFDQAASNDDFRRVVVTNEHTQVVLMTIPPGGEIGSEVHTGVDQILLGIAGTGTSILDGGERPFVRGEAVVVPQGVRHNFVNNGSEPLRLVTVYGPPNHRPGTVHRTKADADRDEADIAPSAQSGSKAMAVRNKELMQALDDAWNNRDWETFEARHVYDTAVYWPGQPEPTRGVQNHRAESVEFFKTFENRLDNRPYRVLIADGEWTCSIARWTGTMTGPMKGPDGTEIPATNKTFDLQFCTVARWKDGQIVEENLFYDQLGLMRQIGLQA